jgi:hypothetical protein
MVIEDIRFEDHWIAKDRDAECRVGDTIVSNSGEILVVVSPLKNMEEYESIDGIIPFHLDSFLDEFKPKLES